MNAIEPTSEATTGMPRAAKLGVGLALGVLALGAVYLYSVRGFAIVLDLSSGIAGLLCL